MSRYGQCVVNEFEKLFLTRYVIVGNVIMIQIFDTQHYGALADGAGSYLMAVSRSEANTEIVLGAWTSAANTP